jgi:D-arabinose 1-dehydrogenase-like Zn-dependent alcohol dehydrogenase
MKAIVIDRPHEVEFREVETPAPGPRDVLVRSRFAGVCRTDLEILDGSLDSRWVVYPCIPGHEWSGTIEAVGERVDDLMPGDQVVCEGYCYCGICRRCRVGQTNFCERYDHLGFTRGGGYGEFVVAPRHVVHLLPQNVGLDVAVLVEPASVVLAGLEQARPQPGEALGVIGIGALGALAITLARLFAPAAIVAYGVREAELELARRLGATETVDVSAGIAPREGELDLVVQTAGAVDALELATRLTREGGRIVALGLAGAGHDLRLPADRFVLRSLALLGSVGYPSAVWARVVQLIATDLVDFSPVIAGRFPTKFFEDAFASMDVSVGRILLEHPVSSPSRNERRT